LDHAVQALMRLAELRVPPFLQWRQMLRMKLEIP
jgi:hypothetical protein